MITLGFCIYIYLSLKYCRNCQDRHVFAVFGCCQGPNIADLMQQIHLSDGVDLLMKLYMNSEQMISGPEEIIKLTCVGCKISLKWTKIRTYIGNKTGSFDISA